MQSNEIDAGYSLALRRVALGRNRETETESLGAALSCHFAWDGIAIMEVFASALEDANFHAECAVVRGWIGGAA